MLRDYKGFGALNSALPQLETIGQKVLVVATQNAWNRFRSLVFDDFFAKRTIQLFSSFSVNPSYSDILSAVDNFRIFDPDIILAIGGGSTIDTAKALKAVSWAKKTTADPEMLQISGNGPLLAAFTTTAGSGSEATQYAMLYSEGKQYTLSHPSLRPEMAVADPELTYSLPPMQTASTGFAALCHAVESFCAPNATAQSQKESAAALRYILPNIVSAVNAPTPAVRFNMSVAAYLAGRAINTTGIPFLYALSGHLMLKCNIPYGHAFALVWPYCFLANPSQSPSLLYLLGQKTSEDVFSFWRSLMAACGLEYSLSQIGIDTAQKIDDFIRSADLCKTTCCPTGFEDKLKALITERERA